jgi:Undecaprenyl-phosphate galactose phosphotransferase WbaP
VILNFPGLYPGYGMNVSEELRRQTHALLATLAFAAVFALTFQIGDTISRFLMGFVFLGLLLCSPLMRHCVKGWMMGHGVWGKPVIIVGTDGPGTRVEDLLTKEWALGYEPIAVFDDQPEGHLVEVKDGGEGMPRRDALDEAVALTRDHSVDTLFLAMPHVPQEYLANLANLASTHFRNVVIIPDLAGVNSSTVVARDFAGTLGVEVRHNLLAPWVRRFKRGLDLIGALVGGLIISPLLVALVVLIKLDSSGPVFFGHRRLGAGDTHFRCWKFRTMHPDAERLLEEYLKDNPHLRTEWEQNHKLRNDPRVTRIGRILRKTSLDELPQLWNVLRAEMSLIGPRPIVDAEIVKYDEVYALYKRVKPGMSGFWQVSGRSDASYDNRVAMDAYYVRNWSVWLDLVILARTVRCVVAGRGAC